MNDGVQFKSLVALVFIALCVAIAFFSMAVTSASWAANGGGYSNFAVRVGLNDFCQCYALDDNFQERKAH